MKRSTIQNSKILHPPTKPLLRARKTQLIGGLLLTISFFLPAVESCNRPVIPAQKFAKAITNSSNPASTLGAVCVYGSPFIIGMLFAIGAAISLAKMTSQNNWTTTAIAWVFATVATIADIAITYEFIVNNRRSTTELILTATFFAITAYTYRAILKGIPGRICLQTFIASILIFWFLPHAISKSAMYGLHFSTAGSILITIGTFNELRARTLATIPQTIRHIILCNPPLIDLDPTKCNHCGYNITHLKTPRCPECGQPCTIPSDDDTIE